MKKTFEELNVHHVTTSFYHPQSNGKVERFHRTMHDILAKKIGHNEQSWDIYINKMLAAVRFHVSETTKFSPYYLLYRASNMERILWSHKTLFCHWIIY